MPNTNILFDPSNMSAFGVLETADLTPLIQGDFVYGLNTQLWNSAVVSGTGATVDTDSSRLRIQSGTNSAGYAYITSRRSIRYRAGQGTVARFTPIFSSTYGLSNNIQLWGIGALQSNIPYDGYFLGFNGTNFGIAHYIRGVANWTYQRDWNNDPCNGSPKSSFTYDPSLGTAVMIKYPYLGFGDIEFFLQNPITGRWILIHVIRYGNTVNSTQLSNPNLYFLGFTLNSGNTTNTILYCGSVGIFLSGQRSFIGNPRWAADNYKTGITAETNIMSIKNCTTYNGNPNRGLIRLNSLSVGGDSAKGEVVIVRLRIGATLGGSPSFAAINGSTADSGVTITSGNSIASKDTAGTTSSAGSLVYNLTIAAPGNSVIDTSPFELIIAPGEILTVGGFGSATAVIAVALNWSEDI